MKERTSAIIITIILLILGLLTGVASSFLYSNANILNQDTSYNKFDFYKSQLDINGTNVKEILSFQTDQQYHTLFRNFQSNISSINDKTIPNSILIRSVTCQIGDPYFKVGNDCYYRDDFTIPNVCVPFTESNEYGCTYANLTEYNQLQEKTNKECVNPQGGIMPACIYNHLIFKQDEIYWISSEFTINPENLFRINESYYIKFIAYGRNSHIPLIVNNNLFINGDAIYSDKYLSKEYVIIYIPYKGDVTGYKIIQQSGFVYDVPISPKSSPGLFFVLIIIIMLAHLLPAMLFFCSWFFFGKELTDEEVPDQLSQYPTKRKPWEVAAFFSPPFGKINQDFFSTMLLDFYRRKIIDLKLVKNMFFGQDLLIKINEKSNEELDNIEKKFLKFLRDLKDSCPDKNIQKDYFNINKSANSQFERLTLQSDYSDLQNSLDKESKRYIEKKGIAFFSTTIVILIVVSFLLLTSLSIFSIISLIVILIISSTTSLIIRYKGEFYTEYQEWKAFKKWLKYSPAMKETGAKGVVMWDEYLVYATALGVSKQVLKELKKEKLIDDKNYNFYAGVYISSSSFAITSRSGASSGVGGGFSGGGGGGVGGGGGGGR